MVKAARDLKRAEKKMFVVNANLINCDVTAPTSGQLFHTSLPKANGRRKIQVGDNVWSGQTFIEIPDDKQLIFEATIREFDLSSISKGQNAIIKLDAFVDKEINANVKLVSTLANENTKTKVNRFSVILSIPNVIHYGHAGMYGQAEINVATVKDKIVVPVNYIKTNGEQAWVWLDEQHSQKRLVTLGVRNHQWGEIISDLSLDETIYL